MPLSTSNSKIQFLLTVIVVMASCCIYAIWIRQFKLEAPAFKDPSEVYHQLDREKSVIILGNSRASTGLVPEYLSDLYQLPTFVAGGWGKRCAGGLAEVNNSTLDTSVIILGVTPIDLFLKESPSAAPDPAVAKFVELGNIRLTDKIENKMVRILKRNIRVFNGYKEYTELLWWGKQLMYQREDGFVRINRLGPELSAVTSKQEWNIYSRYKYYESTDRVTIDSVLKPFTERLEEVRKKHKVIMVRLPINYELKTLEYTKCPFFDTEMNKIAERMGIQYINGFDIFEYPTGNGDGSHLYFNAAEEFTKTLLPLLSREKD